MWAIEGRSGAGKTTVARALAKRLGWRLLPEAYRRRTGRRSISFHTLSELRRVERRLVDEDLRRFAEARRLVRGGKGVVLDTDFLGPLTYSSGLRERVNKELDVVADVKGWLAEALENGSWGLADLYIYLDASEALAARRTTLSRSAHPTAFRDRHRRVGSAERNFFLRVLPKLIPGRVLRVSSASSPADIVSEVLRRAPRSFPAGEPSWRTAANLLRTFHAGSRVSKRRQPL